MAHSRGSHEKNIWKGLPLSGLVQLYALYMHVLH